MANLIKCPDCEKEISSNATACPNCGAPNQFKHQSSQNEPVQVKPKSSIIKKGCGGCLVIIIGFFVLVSLGVFTGLPSSNNTPDTSVTLAKYHQIQNDMTYEQVCKIMGSNGTELTRVSIGGMTQVMVAWEDKSFGSIGANMNVTFHNNKVFGKGQFGLK